MCPLYYGNVSTLDSETRCGRSRVPTHIPPRLPTFPGSVNRAGNNLEVSVHCVWRERCARVRFDRNGSIARLRWIDMCGSERIIDTRYITRSMHRETGVPDGLGKGRENTMCIVRTGSYLGSRDCGRHGLQLGRQSVDTHLGHAPLVFLNATRALELKLVQHGGAKKGGGADGSGEIRLELPRRQNFCGLVFYVSLNNNWALLTRSCAVPRRRVAGFPQSPCPPLARARSRIRV